MGLPLQGAMQDMLSGWQGDLPGDWAAFLDGIAPAADNIDPRLELDVWEPIFPPRLGSHIPGQPEGAHMLRAFHGPSPGSVRCLILGQDPYPSPAVATGRAFEAGNIVRWSEFDRMFTRSLRAWTLALVAARTGRDDLGDFSMWPEIRDALDSGTIGFPAPGDIAAWQEAQGVLLLNAALTLSRFQVQGDPHQTRGHLPLWRPFHLGLLDRLMARGTPLVCMGFGDAAASILSGAGIGEGRDGAIACVLRPHPADADAFLSLPNPFVECNRHLQAMGAAPVDW
ncbi:MAG: hypothetical protein KDE45_02895 [Caldilineaceae bacterium]|nr:hypothetical protein [Caldilineaceae bacterium]